MQELRNQIICDDCVSLLRQVEEPFADLIFADPPFNIGYAYDKYHDKKASDRYITWTTDWIAACAAVLKPHGSFYIAIGDEYAANIKLIADAQGLVLRNWIIWHYSFGQQTKNKFARAHTHIFYFTKDKKDFTFNDEMVRVISDRQKKYADKRANPAGKMPDDVWDEYPRVCGTFIERTGFPCQMPESLLARIIRVSSNEGDWVLDPFCGSGTTAAVAHKLGRVYTTIDLSEQYVEAAKTRIAASEGLSSTGVPPVSTTGILPMEQLGIAKRHGARLPHWTQIGATYAVTFRLADSLPAAVVESWRREREGIEQRARDQNRELTLPERRELQDLYAQKVDSILNNGRGACYLKDERVAGAVQDALRHFHGDHYELIAWAVMPNHVHVVVRPLGDHQLPDILHSWKSFTAKQANDILNRQGQFWQDEYYDHLIRDGEDFQHAVQYVISNPEHAGLHDWAWVGFHETIQGQDAPDTHGRDARATSERGRSPDWPEHADLELRWLYSENKIPIRQLSADRKLLSLLTLKLNQRLQKREHYTPDEVWKRLGILDRTGKLTPLNKASSVRSGALLFKE